MNKMLKKIGIQNISNIEKINEIENQIKKELENITKEKQNSKKYKKLKIY